MNARCVIVAAGFWRGVPALAVSLAGGCVAAEPAAAPVGADAGTGGSGRVGGDTDSGAGPGDAGGADVSADAGPLDGDSAMVGDDADAGTGGAPVDMGVCR